jgi:hypothetical protein
MEDESNVRDEAELHRIEQSASAAIDDISLAGGSSIVILCSWIDESGGTRMTVRQTGNSYAVAGMMNLYLKKVSLEEEGE